uniref:Uncharacterized protein n=1 Tax=Helianthus annuus TaxID=4232 RepID=A0A251VIS7_HELAN
MKLTFSTTDFEERRSQAKERKMEQILYDQVVAPVVKFMASHITKHLGYVFCSTKHVTGMKDKLKDLVDTSTEVIEHKNRNETNDKEIPARVEAW